MNIIAQHAKTKSRYERKHQLSPLITRQGGPCNSRTRDLDQRVVGVIKAPESTVFIDANRPMIRIG